MNLLTGHLGRLLQLVRFDVESHGLEEDVVGICGHIFGHQDHVLVGIAVQNGPGLSVLQFHLLNQLVHFAQNVNDSPVVAADLFLQGVDLLVQMFRYLQGADLSIFNLKIKHFSS